MMLMFQQDEHLPFDSSEMKVKWTKLYCFRIWVIIKKWSNPERQNEKK